MKRITSAQTAAFERATRAAVGAAYEQTTSSKKYGFIQSTARLGTVNKRQALIVFTFQLPYKYASSPVGLSASVIVQQRDGGWSTVHTSAPVQLRSLSTRVLTAQMNKLVSQMADDTARYSTKADSYSMRGRTYKKYPLRRNKR
jgi:hypothetical protein